MEPRRCVSPCGTCVYSLLLGRIILCIHQPPRATLRSVHDGRELGELLLPNTLTRITGAWWIEPDEQPPTDELGDLMKRGPNTPGSAHSLLARLPLLDPYKEPLPARTHDFWPARPQTDSRLAYTLTCRAEHPISPSLTHYGIACPRR
ncbi:hypothetical protein B0J17DRAFT_25342 [Rhizoctonia solani]|nr:hypothetical protein B0J17DRAFT_25342 [Rhizoctonia solani]